MEILPLSSASVFGSFGLVVFSKDYLIAEIAGDKVGGLTQCRMFAALFRMFVTSTRNRTELLLFSSY